MSSEFEELAEAVRLSTSGAIEIFRFEMQNFVEKMTAGAKTDSPLFRIDGYDEMDYRHAVDIAYALKKISKL